MGDNMRSDRTDTPEGWITTDAFVHNVHTVTLSNSQKHENQIPVTQASLSVLEYQPMVRLYDPHRDAIYRSQEHAGQYDDRVTGAANGFSPDQHFAFAGVAITSHLSPTPGSEKRVTLVRSGKITMLNNSLEVLYPGNHVRLRFPRQDRNKEWEKQSYGGHNMFIPDSFPFIMEKCKNCTESLRPENIADDVAIEIQKELLTDFRAGDLTGDDIEKQRNKLSASVDVLFNATGNHDPIELCVYQYANQRQHDVTWPVLQNNYRADLSSLVLPSERRRVDMQPADNTHDIFYRALYHLTLFYILLIQAGNIRVHGYPSGRTAVKQYLPTWRVITSFNFMLLGEIGYIIGTEKWKNDGMVIGKVLSITRPGDMVTVLLSTPK
jgi:hypothetical protein